MVGTRLPPVTSNWSRRQKLSGASGGVSCIVRKSSLFSENYYTQKFKNSQGNMFPPYLGNIGRFFSDGQLTGSNSVVAGRIARIGKVWIVLRRSLTTSEGNCARNQVIRWSSIPTLDRLMSITHTNSKLQILRRNFQKRPHHVGCIQRMSSRSHYPGK